MLEYSHEIILGCAFCIIAYFLLKKFIIYQKYRHIPGPKAEGILGFLFGNIIELRRRNLNGISRPETILEWTQIYGPVFKFRIFNYINVVVTDPEAIRLITIEKNFPKEPFIYKNMGFPLNERCGGRGLATEWDNEEWRHRRAQYNPGFHKSVLMDSLKEFNSRSDIFLTKLRSLADDKTSVTLLIELNKLTLEVISTVSCGLNIDAINDPNNKLNSQITKCLYFAAETFTDFLMPLRRNKSNEAIRSFKNLRKFAKEIVFDRLKEIERSGLLNNDILSVVISKSKAEKMDFDIMIDDFLTLFIAGQETTANAIAFSIFELCQNPDVLQKMREEIDRVLGSRTEINNDDLANLEYVECVFKESLRKYPPAAGLHRRTTEDIVINGYKIPKNTWISTSQFACHRNPENFPEPDKFIPERFLKDSEFSKKNKITSYTYFPFALGPRNCLGQNFAQIEGKVILTKLIQNFNFRLEPNQTSRIDEFITLRLTDGCKVFISPRNF